MPRRTARSSKGGRTETGTAREGRGGWNKDGNGGRESGNERGGQQGPG